jgi:pimeloyl-ACP methyl ester carboxylesterase
VLQCLARRPGALVTKDELIRCVWPGVIVSDDSLVQCITELRRALHDDAHRIVQTEQRRGYRLMASPLNTNLPVAPEGAEAFRQDIRVATTADAVRIAYASSGEGPPLVRAAHWMTHLDWDWRSATLGPRIRAFSRRNKLLRYDGRSYGMSDRDAAPGTLNDCVHELETVVNCAGVEQFALFGAASGGPIAIRFAAQHPQRVACLVLQGSFARGVLRRGARGTPLDQFEALLCLIGHGWKQENPAFRQLLTSMIWPAANASQMNSFNHLQRVSCTPEAAVALMRRHAEFDACDDLSRIDCPTLVLHSPKDSYVPFEESRLMAAAIHGARLEPFDSVNHSPLDGEPAFDQVARSINQFLLDAGQAARPLARRDSARHTLHAVDGGLSGSAAVPFSRKAS